jgi:hypothetical protein
MNHAGDWTQLGHSRFRFQGKIKKILDTKTIKFELDTFDFVTVQPERRYPNDIETKFRVW